MTKGQSSVQNPLVVDVRQFCAIKYIAARTRIHCATAIFNHKLVTTQVAVCSRSFLLPLPLGEGRGEGSPMAMSMSIPKPAALTLTLSQREREKNCKTKT